MNSPTSSTLSFSSQDAERQARHLRLIVYTLLAASIVLVQLENPINRAISIAMIFVSFGVLILVHYKAIKLASYIVPVGLFITFTTYMYNGKGMIDPAIFGYTVVIIIGGLLIGQRGVIIYGVLSIVGVWCIYWAGSNDYIGSKAITEDSYAFTTATYITAYLFVTGVVLRATIQVLQNSIQSARRNAIALENLNQELEARVEQRTKALHDSRQQTEALSRIGKTINAATTYTEIIEAIVYEIGAVDYNISLNIYENYERKDATYVRTVALLTPQQTTATPQDIRIPINHIATDTSGMVVIEDIEQHHIHRSQVTDLLKSYQLRALMSYDFTLGNRTIGTLTFSSVTPRRFSAFERDLIQGVGELAAAATERSRLYAEQVEIAEQLRAVDKLKSQFLASMSHELRTPLNAILNFTEFIQMGILGDVNEKQADALSKTLLSGRHLLSLINDILDITKIESGMMRLFIEADVDISQEINTVVASTKTLLANKKDVKLVQDVDTSLPLIVADKRRIRQILLNLLSNAVKFTDSGSITFSVKKIDDNILFAVSDTGPGIASEEIELIFEPFQQTEAGLRHAGGTGLGLPITKRLVEAHLGKIWLESEVGEGATFYVKLPIHSEALLGLIGVPEVKAHV